MNDAARPASDTDRPDSQVTTHYATFDWEEYEPISSTVVSTVARAAGVPPADLEELHDYVEPCALDQLFQPIREGARTTTGQVTFEYVGYEVTVHSFGQIVVRPGETGRPD